MVLARNEWDSHGEAEAILVDLDWIMRSPSPVELYGPIYSTFYPTYDVQPYEDTDVAMGSPAHPTRSPTPEQIQDPASLESYWGAEPPRFTTPAEVFLKIPRHGASILLTPPPQRKVPSHGDTPRGRPTLPQDEPTEDSSRGTKPPRSSTPGPLQDAWESFSW